MNTQKTPLYQFLLTAGLSKNEANIYFALLEMGPSSVTQISKTAKVTRTSAYAILDQLAGKKMVSVLGKEPKKEYAAESPEHLRTIVDMRVEAAKRLQEQANLAIPELKSLHSIAKRPRVRFYEGKEGLQEVYEDTLTSHGPILAYASVEHTEGTLPHYFPKYYKRRAANKIPIRAIFPLSQESLSLSKRDKDELRESLFIPKQEYGFSPEINIYDNKVMIASWKENLGIIMESQEIAMALRKIFELSWLGAQTLAKRI